MASKKCPPCPTCPPCDSPSMRSGRKGAKPRKKVAAGAAEQVPCLKVRVAKGQSVGAGQIIDGCLVTGARGNYGVSRWELGRDYKATTRNVSDPKKYPPCNQARKGCPVQLAFDNGQPLLRFCVGKKQKGHRIDVNTPAEAIAVATEACAPYAPEFTAEGKPIPFTGEFASKVYTLPLGSRGYRRTRRTK